MNKTILFYKARLCKVPFKDWISKLKDVKAKTIIKTRIDRMIYGNYGDWKHIKGNVKELRINYGAGYRIYFCELRDNTILILNAGTKNTQRQDIMKALRYWYSYKERFGHEIETTIN